MLLSTRNMKKIQTWNDFPAAKQKTKICVNELAHQITLLFQPVVLKGPFTICVINEKKNSQLTSPCWIRPPKTQETPPWCWMMTNTVPERIHGPHHCWVWLSGCLGVYIWTWKGTKSVQSVQYISLRTSEVLWEGMMRLYESYKNIFKHNLWCHCRDSYCWECLRQLRVLVKWSTIVQCSHTNCS